MSSRWIKWFSEEDTTQAAADFAVALQEAHDCLKVAEMSWFQKFLGTLAEESLRGGEIGDHLKMIASVARANAFRDIRAKIMDDVAKARVFIESAKEA